MARTLEYDDRQLRELYAQMGEKQRAQAMKGAFRGAARLLRSASVSVLRTDVSSNRELEKGVRALVFKEKLGFRVTVGTVIRKARNRMGWVGVKGFYKNKQYYKNPQRYSEKPVLIWAEDGTKERRLRGGRGSHQTKRGFRKRYLFNGAFRGRMKPYLFLVEGQRQVGPHINQSLQDNFRTSVEKTAKKYGCTV